MAEVYIIVELPSDGDLNVQAFTSLGEATLRFGEIRDLHAAQGAVDDDPWSDADGKEAGFETYVGRVWRLRCDLT